MKVIVHPPGNYPMTRIVPNKHTPVVFTFVPRLIESTYLKNEQGEPLVWAAHYLPIYLPGEES